MGFLVLISVVTGALGFAIAARIQPGMAWFIFGAFVLAVFLYILYVELHSDGSGMTALFVTAMALLPGGAYAIGAAIGTFKYRQK